MNATAQQLAPGCFGAASVYAMDSAVCEACPAYSACGEQALANLEQLREIVDVRDILARHKAARQKSRHALTPPAPPVPVAASPIPVAQPAPPQAVERKTPQTKVAFEIPAADQIVIEMIGKNSVKAKEAAIVLCKSNKINDMRAMLPKGINPFAQTGPKYLNVICDMLLGGGFTKATYKARMMQQFAWTDGTAGSHVAIGVALLYSFRIVTADSSGAFILNPALFADNNVSA